MTQSTSAQLLAELGELVGTGPVGLGAYTQAEMAVVLGDVPALAGSNDEVLAEAVRALAARGVLHRVPGQPEAEIVGDLGLLAGLAQTSVGVLDIRRGHPGELDEPWRWLISLFGQDVVGLDRIDPLGIHRLSLHSVPGVARLVAERMLSGPARVRVDAPPTPLTDNEVRELAGRASQRWQLIHRVPRPDGSRLIVDSLVLRLGETEVVLVTRDPDCAAYRRLAVDEARLADFLRGMFSLR